VSKQLAQGHSLPSRIVAWPKCETWTARPERQRV